MVFRKGICMDTLAYEGKTFKRRNGKWTDSLGMIAHEGLQRILNQKYAESIEPTALSPEECIEKGDAFKESGSVGLALKFYEAAIEQSDKRTMAAVLPRIASCYRMNGQPEKAIKVLTYASDMYGREMISSALLTSAAAAYCDIGDYIKAKKCCDRAFASAGGKGSAELSLVYKRIEKETK